jgi:hypothetical protein
VTYRTPGGSTSQAGIAAQASHAAQQGRELGWLDALDITQAAQDRHDGGLRRERSAQTDDEHRMRMSAAMWAFDLDPDDRDRKTPQEAIGRADPAHDALTSLHVLAGQRAVAAQPAPDGEHRASWRSSASIASAARADARLTARARQGCRDRGHGPMASSV